jgi:hypothetical protein
MVSCTSCAPAPATSLPQRGQPEAVEYELAAEIKSAALASMRAWCNMSRAQRDEYNRGHEEVATLLHRVKAMKKSFKASQAGASAAPAEPPITWRQIRDAERRLAARQNIFYDGLQPEVSRDGARTEIPAGVPAKSRQNSLRGYCG